MKEREIQKMILDYLRYQKIFCWKNNSIGIYKAKTGQYIPIGMKGVSDILGILSDGRFLAIEVKQEKTKPTDNQKEFINNINKHGGLAFIARSVDDVMKMLKINKNLCRKEIHK